MMNGYIKKEDAVEAVWRILNGMGYSQKHNDRLVEEVDAVIDEYAAADVRPVVRGKWSVQEIYKHEMSYGTTAYEPVYKCSACGNLMESYLRYDEPIMPEDADFPRFCPNCGADMREEN